MNLDNLTIRNKILLANSVALISIVLISITAFINFRESQETMRWVHHTQEVIAQANLLTKQLLDMETGERGFLITGDETFLEPYHSGKREFDETLNRLIKTVSDNPTQMERLREIGRLENRWQEVAAIPEISIRRKVDEVSIDTENLQEHLARGHGKSILDRIREVLDRMEADFVKAGHFRGQLLARSIAKNMVDMETGERGFLITGKDEFLEPFIAGQRELQTNLAELSAIVMKSFDEARSRENLASLKRLSSQWLVEAAMPEIEMRREINRAGVTFKSVVALIQSLSGKHIMDDLRTRLAEFISIEENLMVTREARARKAQGFAIWMIVLGSLIALLLSTLIALRVSRRIAEPINELVTIFDEMARGHLSQSVAVTGRDEAGQLGNAFNAMAGRLQEKEHFISELSRGRLSISLDLASDRDKLGIALLRMAETLRNITLMAERITMGDTTLKVEVQGKDDALSISLNKMTEILGKITQIAERVAAGDTSMKVVQQSDNDLLAMSINKMVDTLREAASQADDIARGDYRTEIQPRGERDRLGFALQKMTRELRRLIEKNERQLWLSDGIAKIGEIVRGETDMRHITSQLCQFFARYLDCQIATFYVMEGERLILAGSYAFDRRKDLNNSIEIGQGFVGQAALEKQVISVTSIPEDYTRINSSIGAILPRNIVVVPFISMGHVFGVMELGSFEVLCDEKLKFLKQTVEPIGITLSTVEEGKKTRELLEITRAQSEKLKSQQEEMAVQNEELMEQTRALKYSEEQLKVQTEALRVSNEELEEKTESLIRQKREVEDKSQLLEQTGRELEQQISPHGISQST